MSPHVFWQTVRIAYERAMSSEAGDLDEPIGWAPGVQAVQRSLASNLDLWLSPNVVADFYIDDFDFLPEADRSRLKEAVDNFRSVAAKVPPAEPTTKAQRDEARPFLLEIAKILDFERYQDPDALRLGKLIERELARYRLDRIARLEFRTDFDHTGDPGIWIRVYLDEASSKTDDEFLENAREIRPILDSVARQVIGEDDRRLIRAGRRGEALERWPYISFRSIGERAEAVGAS